MATTRKAETAVQDALSRRKAAARARKPQPGVMRINRGAVTRIAGQAEAKPVYVAPGLPLGVVPEGKSAPVLAMDDAWGGVPMLDYFASMGNTHAVSFPGYPYLAQLATRAEYRNMADALALEMTREWIDFDCSMETGPDAGEDEQAMRAAKMERIKELETEFKRLGVQNLFKQAVTHDAWYGRAQFFIDIKGHKRNRPLILSPKTIPQGSLMGVRTVEAMWTTPSMYNALDPAAPDFYKPTTWFMLGQEVHAQRLLTVVTRPVSDMLKPSFNFSGLSLSQIAEPYVNNWLKTRTAVGDIVTNFSTTALKTNMSQVLTGGDDGDSLVSRADLFTAYRTNRGLFLLDKDDEDLVQLNTPLSTLDALQAQSQEHMCSVSRIPAMILTGISPTGLNASSEGEIRAWYDWIRAQQEANWRDPLEIILKVVMLHLWGDIDDSIVVNFRPLHKLTPLEESDRRYKDMQTATGYVAAAVLDPTEVRQNLASDPLSGYSHIDPEEAPVSPDELNGGGTADMFGKDPAEDPDEGDPGTTATDPDAPVVGSQPVENRDDNPAVAEATQ